MKRIYVGSKPKRQYLESTHIGWRTEPQLRERFNDFLERNPPATRSEYLNQALAYYLDAVDRHGLNPQTLRPKK